MAKRVAQRQRGDVGEEGDHVHEGRWLRLVEMRAADWLPDDEMRELTAAIDGVVDLLRAATERPSCT